MRLGVLYLQRDRIASFFFFSLRAKQSQYQSGFFSVALKDARSKAAVGCEHPGAGGGSECWSGTSV